MQSATKKFFAGLAFLTAALALWPLIWASSAEAQQWNDYSTGVNMEFRNRNYNSTEYSGRNTYTPAEPLTVFMVRDEVRRRIERSQYNERAIWEAGNDFFRNYPRTKATVDVIKEGYLLAAKESSNQALSLSLRNAAIYWEKIQEYGYTVEQTGTRLRQEGDKVHYGDSSQATSLDKWATSTGGKRQSTINYEYAGRFVTNKAGATQSSATFGSFSNTRPELANK